MGEAAGMGTTGNVAAEEGMHVTVEMQPEGMEPGQTSQDVVESPTVEEIAEVQQVETPTMQETLNEQETPEEAVQKAQLIAQTARRELDELLEKLHAEQVTDT